MSSEPTDGNEMVHRRRHADEAGADTSVEGCRGRRGTREWTSRASLLP